MRLIMVCANSLCCIRGNKKRNILVVSTVEEILVKLGVVKYDLNLHTACTSEIISFCWKKLGGNGCLLCDFKGFPFFSYELKGQNLSVCCGALSRSCVRACNDSCRQAAYCHSSFSFLQLMWQLNSR